MLFYIHTFHSYSVRLSTHNQVSGNSVRIRVGVRFSGPPAFGGGGTGAAARTVPSAAPAPTRGPPPKPTPGPPGAAIGLNGELKNGLPATNIGRNCFAINIILDNFFFRLYCASSFSINNECSFLPSQQTKLFDWLNYLQYFGHIMRKETSIEKQIRDSRRSERYRGRPITSWRDSIKAVTGSLAVATRKAADRDGWQALIKATAAPKGAI